MKKIYINDIIKSKTYGALEDYGKENKVGLVNIYLIVSPDLKEQLGINDTNLFYGVKVAVDNSLGAGEAVIVR